MLVNDDWRPWPLSEVSDAERRRILALPKPDYDRTIARLKKELANGEYERRQRHRILDEAGA